MTEARGEGATWAEIGTYVSRLLLAIVIVGAALVLAFRPIEAAWFFGLSNALAGSSQEVSASGYVAMEVLRLVFVIAIIDLKSRKQWGAVFCCALVWLILAAVSVGMLVGKDAMVRWSQGAQQAQTERIVAETRANLARVEARLRQIKEDRPVAVIDRLLTAERLSKRWGATKQCSEATGGENERFCRGYERLNADREAAVEADGLRQRVDDLTAKLETALTAVPTSDAGAWVAMIAYATGDNAENAAIRSSILIALLACGLPDFALMVAGWIWPVWPGRRRQDELRWKPEGEAGALVHGNSSSAGPGTTSDEPSIDAPGRVIGAQIPVVLGRPTGPVRNPAEVSASRAIGRVSATGPNQPTKRSSSDQPSASSNCSSSAVGQDDRKAAVVAFVGLLDRDQSARVSGADLFAAYRARRPIHGGPDLTVTEFGTLARDAVIALGGRKGRSNGVVYTGVSIPAGWKLHAVANSNQAEGA